MNYRFSDGTASGVVVRPADDDVILAITNPFLVQDAQPIDSLFIGVRKAGLEHDVAALAASFATTYSNTLLSLGVGAVVPALALEESTQTMLEITRMPKAPFFTLIALNCLYALLGIALAIMVLASKPRTVKPIQARLSSLGIVAALFEGNRAEKQVTNMSQLFEESTPGDGRPTGKATLLPTIQGGLQWTKVAV
jgi:hypothetical protein